MSKELTEELLAYLEKNLKGYTIYKIDDPVFIHPETNKETKAFSIKGPSLNKETGFKELSEMIQDNLKDRSKYIGILSAEECFYTNTLSFSKIRMYF